MVQALVFLNKELTTISFFHSKTQAQINEAYDQLSPQRNTKPVLTKRRQVDKKIESGFGNIIAQWEIYKQLLKVW